MAKCARSAHISLHRQVARSNRESAWRLVLFGDCATAFNMRWPLRSSWFPTCAGVRVLFGSLSLPHQVAVLLTCAARVGGVCKAALL